MFTDVLFLFFNVSDACESMTKGCLYMTKFIHYCTSLLSNLSAGPKSFKNVSTIRGALGFNDKIMHYDLVLRRIIYT